MSYEYGLTISLRLINPLPKRIYQDELKNIVKAGKVSFVYRLLFKNIRFGNIHLFLSGHSH